MALDLTSLSLFNLNTPRPGRRFIEVPVGPRPRHLSREAPSCGGCQPTSLSARVRIALRSRAISALLHVHVGTQLWPERNAARGLLTATNGGVIG